MMVSKTAVILSPQIFKSDMVNPIIHSLEQFHSLLEACSFSVIMRSQAIDQILDDINAVDILCIDMANHHSNAFVDKLLSLKTKLPSVVLINVPSTGLCEKRALVKGIKGVFYSDDRRDIVLKGIESVHAGDAWFKRATFNEVLKDLLDSSNNINPSTSLQPSKLKVRNSVLTKREWMIVELVAKGAQNIEIATELSISVNTVKTHIYSIFRKTNCRNRVELITWSQMSEMTA